MRTLFNISPLVLLLVLAVPVAQMHAQDDSVPTEVDFIATLQDGKAALLWTFYGQLSAYGFYVERRDGLNEPWQELGFVNDGLCVFGACSYQFTDYSLPIGVDAVYYRVKVLRGFDNGWYTKDVLLDLNTLLPQRVTLYQNYPNPVGNTTASTFVRFRLPDPANVTLTVYTADGRIVARMVDEFRPAGTYTEQLPTSDLPAGVYFYRLNTGDVQQVKRLVVQR